jgi:hypothetical protein
LKSRKLDFWARKVWENSLEMSLPGPEQQPDQEKKERAIVVSQFQGYIDSKKFYQHPSF